MPMKAGGGVAGHPGHLLRATRQLGGRDPGAARRTGRREDPRRPGRGRLSAPGVHQAGTGPADRVLRADRAARLGGGLRQGQLQGPVPGDRAGTGTRATSDGAGPGEQPPGTPRWLKAVLAGGATPLEPPDGSRPCWPGGATPLEPPDGSRPRSFVTGPWPCWPGERPPGTSSYPAGHANWPLAPGRPRGAFR